jgi:hypothetical protein
VAVVRAAAGRAAARGARGAAQCRPASARLCIVAATIQDSNVLYTRP